MHSSRRRREPDNRRGTESGRARGVQFATHESLAAGSAFVVLVVESASGARQQLREATRIPNSESEMALCHVLFMLAGIHVDILYGGVGGGGMESSCCIRMWRSSSNLRRFCRKVVREVFVGERGG